MAIRRPSAWVSMPSLARMSPVLPPCPAETAAARAWITRSRVSFSNFISPLTDSTRLGIRSWRLLSCTSIWRKAFATWLRSFISPLKVITRQPPRSKSTIANTIILPPVCSLSRLGKYLAAGLRDQHRIFYAHAELAAQVDAGLHGDRHPGAQHRLESGVKPGEFVDLQAYAVARAVDEILPVAGVGNIAAAGGVHVARLDPGAHFGQTRFLRGRDRGIDLFIFFRGLAVEIAARDVGTVVAVDAAVVQQHGLVVLQLPLRGLVVRHGGVGTEAYYQVERGALGAHGLHRVLELAVDGKLGAAGLYAGLHQAEGLGGDAAGLAEDFHLLPFLDGPERPCKAVLFQQAGFAPGGSADIGLRLRLESSALQLEFLDAGPGRRPALSSLDRPRRATPPPPTSRPGQTLIS